MTAPKNAPGRPRTERMTEALRRVAAGETAYAVARDLGIRENQLYRAVKLARQAEKNRA